MVAFNKTARNKFGQKVKMMVPMTGQVFFYFQVGSGRRGDGQVGGE